MPAENRARRGLVELTTSREHRSILISLAMHATLLILLVWFAIPNGDRSFVLSLSATSSDIDPAAVEFDSTPAIELPPTLSDSNEMSVTNVDIWSAGASTVAFAKPGNGMKSTRQSLEFFGSQAYGNRFVYVLDISQSMDARGNERIGRARDVVIRSISSLRPSQEFSVILFSYRTILIFW